MPSVADVRDGLAQAITTGCGLRASPYVSDSIAVPCAHVFRREMDPRMVFGGSKSTYLFGVRVFVGRVAEIAAQKTLDVLADPDPTENGSLITAIQDGDNWPTTVDYAEVTSIGEPQSVTVADETFLTVDFDVEVVF